MEASAPTAKRRNAALIERRKALNISQEKLAYKVWSDGQACGDIAAALKSVTRHVKRIESGEIANPTDVYKRLIARALRCDQTEVFGEPVVKIAAGGVFQAVTHKFIPVFVGTASLSRTAAEFNLPETDAEAEYTHAGRIDHPDGDATLYLFPWGVALLHLAVSVRMQCIADIARWRVAAYPQDMAWMSSAVSEALGHPVDSNYVLSLYWLINGIWPAHQIESAVNLMSMPRVLLGERRPDRSVGAEQCEAMLLRDGFTHPGIVSFGVPGTSIAAASWSSIAYHPTVPSRALSQTDLVRFEVLTQAMWCYARTICDRVEAGHDPAISQEFGVRFLRAMRSRCFTARPWESSAYRSMREAIVQTSDLAAQLDGAMTALQDT